MTGDVAYDMFPPVPYCIVIPPSQLWLSCNIIYPLWLSFRMVYPQCCTVNGECLRGM